MRTAAGRGWLYRKLPLSARERNVSSVDGVVNVSDGIVDDRRGGIARSSLRRRGELGAVRADKSRKP